MEETAEIVELRDKVKSKDDELHKLRTVAKRAIGDYDDLYGKYREAKKTNDDLLTKYHEQEVKLEQVIQVLQGAANDFAALETKVEVSQYLQAEAEKYASKMYRENREMKHQSQVLMQALNENAIAVDINFDTESVASESSSTASDAQIASLTETISQLEKTLETLNIQLNNTEIEKHSAVTKAEEYKSLLETEKQKLGIAENSIKMYETMKENFVKVSQMAEKRIEFLENQLQFEHDMKEEVVQKASGLHKKHQVLKRQSFAFVHSPNNNESLNKALEQIQKLTLDMENQKVEFEKKLAEASDDKVSEKVEKLQKDIDTLYSENESISKQNEDLLHQLENANYDVRLLRDQLDQAKRGPPPPPPPPPPPIRVINPIKWMMKSKSATQQSQKGPKKPEGAENFDKALAELMDRIKNKKSSEPSQGLQDLLQKDTNQTSKQLNEFIGVLKKTDYKPVKQQEKEPAPEFEFQIMKRKLSQPKEALKPLVEQATEREDGVELRRANTSRN